MNRTLAVSHAENLMTNLLGRKYPNIMVNSLRNRDLPKRDICLWSLILFYWKKSQSNQLRSNLSQLHYSLESVLMNEKAKENV
eukprot:snap_masked-scaffold_49-processed-gene-1.67-mRNA-1 protein AED:1.00 eAED:1.00 QI:0/0/0/0/1/1/2/0/82